MTMEQYREVKILFDKRGRLDKSLKWISGNYNRDYCTGHISLGKEEYETAVRLHDLLDASIINNIVHTNIVPLLKVELQNVEDRLRELGMELGE